MITLKNKCMLAYCHTILTDAEEYTEQGKGIAIVDAQETQTFLRDCGFKIISFCESIGATRADLALLQRSSSPLFELAYLYYELQIKMYNKNIAKVDGRHIPVLYAGLMFQFLFKSGAIGLNIDYDRLIEEIESSKVLETTQVKSKFSDKMITQRTEIHRYNNAVKEILEATNSFKVVRKAKNSIRKKRARR